MGENGVYLECQDVRVQGCEDTIGAPPTCMPPMRPVGTFLGTDGKRSRRTFGHTSIFLLLVAVYSARPLPPAIAEDVTPQVPPIPRASILAAHVVTQGSWYLMSVKETEWLKRVTASKPWHAPKGSLVSPARLRHKIVLWGTDENRLVPMDVIELNDEALLFFSWKSMKWYTTLKVDKDNVPVVPAKEWTKYNAIRDFLARIDKGIERPVVSQGEKKKVKVDVPEGSKRTGKGDR